MFDTYIRLNIKKKEDCTYAKRDEKGVSDSLSQ